jgi:hypothetical protein
MSEGPWHVLDAPGVPCIGCEQTICAEPRWAGEAGPMCDECLWEYIERFESAFGEINHADRLSWT